MTTFQSSFLLQLYYKGQPAIVVFRPLGVRILHDTKPARYILLPIVVHTRALAFIARLLIPGS